MTIDLNFGGNEDCVPAASCTTTRTCNPKPPEPPAEYCGLPVTCETDPTHTPAPPCPPPCAPCPVYFCPAPEPKCPEDHSPCTAPEDIPCGCDWIQECERSIPPAIPCPPIHTGWGQYDGGIMYWSDMCDLHDCHDLLSRLCWLPSYDYQQWDWHHVLDLSTANDINTNLAVRRNGLIQNIDVQEFINLSVRMMRLGAMSNAVPELVPPKPADLGLMAVQTGETEDGVPTYGIALTYQGTPVGTPMSLETEWDENGQPVAMRFPASLIPPLQ